jgi:hypothetical protein
VKGRTAAKSAAAAAGFPLKGVTRPALAVAARRVRRVSDGTDMASSSVALSSD